MKIDKSRETILDEIFKLTIKLMSRGELIKHQKEFQYFCEK